MTARFVRRGFVSFALGIASCGAAAAASALPPGPPITAATAASGRSVAYRIRDIGRPSSARYSYTLAVAFNDAEQIAGEGNPVGNGNLFPVRHCIVWSGRFIDVTSSPGTSNCTVGSMSGLDAHGTSRVVGELTIPYMRSFVPFEVTVARDGETATRVFSDRLGMLDGVNTAGEASGTGTQKPIGKNVEGSGYFVVPPGSNDFIPLQPQCVGLTEACLEPNDILTSCHFGGCSIDNAGLLLGSDRATRRPMTYTYGRPDSGRDLPFAYSAPSNPLTPQLVLNDSGQVLYNTLVSGAVVPYVFAIATSQSKRIPPLPNNSCSSYIASSMNDEGDVLGYTTTCTQPGDAVFWTWSAHGGIANLNARVQLGPYSSVYPIGINNHGSILAMLYRSTSNDGDWGTLEPISADPLPLNKTLPSRQTPPSR